MNLQSLFLIRSICLLPIFISVSEISLCGPPGKLSADTIQLAEKVYLHIDRSSYATGDDIWFRAYVIDPSTNKFSLNTNNLHVDLLAADTRLIFSNTLRIDKGLGNGDFHLTDSIRSGIYRIRAYTNHMRNYDDHFFFTREISILNPRDDGGDLDLPEKLIENKISIQFFPEGGSLVDNVTSAVAFKAVDALGRGCEVTVELYSTSGELITVFNSNRLGMGFFNLKPLPGSGYYTICKGRDGTTVKALLPRSFPAGIAIRTTISQDKDLILTVSTNAVTFETIRGKELSVNLSCRNLINKKVKVRIDSLINNFLIPLDEMPSGIIRVNLAEFEGLPLAERLFFLQRAEAGLKITAERNEYYAREKVSLSLSLEGDSSFSGEGDFSLSAARADYTDKSSPFPETIASWFLLQSDVKGNVEQPSCYFDPSNNKRLQDLDLLLMTQGWRDFQWKYDSLRSFDHEIGFDISGNVKRVLTGKPVAGAKINLGLFSDNRSAFELTSTAKDGSFSFNKLEFYGKTEAFISSTDNLERIKGKIEVDRLIRKPPDAAPMIPDSIRNKIFEKKIPIFRQEAVVRNEARKKYRLSDTIKVGEVEIVASKAETPQEIKIREVRKFYSVPDKERIVTVAEENYSGDIFSYMSGRIPGVRVERGVNSKSIYYPDDVRVTIRGQKGSDSTGALILLDGFEVESDALGYVLNLSMKAIDRIDVLTASPLYGMRGANGVINIITRVGLRRDPVTLDVNSAYLILKGFDNPRIFYSPYYEKPLQQANVPDYRSTLYWNPDLRIEKGKKTGISFYNDDEKGTVSVIVEGVTREGIPLSAKTEYINK